MDLTAPNTPSNARTRWVVDPALSEVTFKVKKRTVANVKGAFQRFNGSIEAVGSDLGNAKVLATIDASGIFCNRTGTGMGMAHPPGPSHLVFTGKAMDHKGGNAYQLTGDLTIKGITRPVVWDVAFRGRITDRWGKERLVFYLNGAIDRNEWGLVLHPALLLEGHHGADLVQIGAEVQFTHLA